MADHYVILCVCGRRREAHPVDTPTYHCSRFVPTEEQTRKGPTPEDDLPVAVLQQHTYWYGP